MKKIKFGLFTLLVLFLFSSPLNSAASSKYIDLIEKHNRKEVHYYEKNSIEIVDQKELTLTAETKVIDDHLFIQKQTEFEKQQAKWYKSKLATELKTANTTEEIDLIIAKLNEQLTANTENFKLQNSNLSKEVINKEEKKVIVLAVKYNTVRDKFFKTANHEIFLLDVNSLEILDSQKFVLTKEYNDFVEKHKNDEKSDFQEKNGIIVLILIGLTIVFPIFWHKFNE